MKFAATGTESHRNGAPRGIGQAKKRTNGIAVATVHMVLRMSVRASHLRRGRMTPVFATNTGVCSGKHALALPYP